MGNLLVGRHLLCARAWLPDHTSPVFEPTEALEAHVPSGWYRTPPPVVVFLPTCEELLAPDTAAALGHLRTVEGFPVGLDQRRTWARCFDLELSWLLMTLQDSGTRRRLHGAPPPAERKSFDEQLLAAFGYFLGDLAGERDRVGDWRPELARTAAVSGADPIGAVDFAIALGDLCYPEEYASLARSSGAVMSAPSQNHQLEDAMWQVCRGPVTADGRLQPTVDELVAAALLLNGERSG